MRWQLPPGVVATLEQMEDITMTMRYSHLAPDHLRAAVAVLDDVLPAPKSWESAEVSTQESVAVGDVSRKSL